MVCYFFLGRNSDINHSFWHVPLDCPAVLRLLGQGYMGQVDVWNCKEFEAKEYMS